MRYISLIAVVTLIVLIGLDAGCMKCGEKAGERLAERALEAASGGKAKVDVGSVDISSLPAHLRYPNAVAKAKWEISSDEGKGTNYTFESSDPKAKVVEFYNTALGNWKKSMTSETPEATTMAYVSPGEDEMVFIVIGTEQDKTTFNLTHTKK